MKKLFILATVAISLNCKADDLTAVVTNTDPWLSTGSVDLSVSGGIAPFTYSWSGPSAFSATTEDVSGLEYGLYTVTVTDFYCGVAVLEIMVDSLVNDAGIEESDNLDISIFPNPASTILNIQSNIPVDIEMYNTNGELLLEKKNAKLIDLSGLSDGVYMVKLFTTEGILTRQIIKK